MYHISPLLPAVYTYLPLAVRTYAVGAARLARLPNIRELCNEKVLISMGSAGDAAVPATVGDGVLLTTAESALATVAACEVAILLAEDEVATGEEAKLAVAETTALLIDVTTLLELEIIDELDFADELEGTRVLIAA